jgi:hypothetical protein
MQQKVASVHQGCRLLPAVGFHHHGKQCFEGFRLQQYLQGEYFCPHPPDIYTGKFSMDLICICFSLKSKIMRSNFALP